MSATIVKINGLPIISLGHYTMAQRSADKATEILRRIHPRKVLPPYLVRTAKGYRPAASIQLARQMFRAVADRPT